MGTCGSMRMSIKAPSLLRKQMTKQTIRKPETAAYLNKQK